jgi:hypothetical protein
MGARVSGRRWGSATPGSTWWLGATGPAGGKPAPVRVPAGADGAAVEVAADAGARSGAGTGATAEDSGRRRRPRPRPTATPGARRGARGAAPDTDEQPEVDLDAFPATSSAYGSRPASTRESRRQPWATQGRSGVAASGTAMRWQPGHETEPKRRRPETVSRAHDSDRQDRRRRSREDSPGKSKAGEMAGHGREGQQAPPAAAPPRRRPRAGSPTSREARGRTGEDRERAAPTRLRRQRQDGRRFDAGAVDAIVPQVTDGDGHHAA